MIQIEAVDLSPRDIGLRVIVVNDGQTVPGVLTKISSFGFESYSTFGRPKRVERRNISFAIKADSGIDVDYGKVPADFVLQVDRPVTTSMDSEGSK